jgi:hypothetical protein
VAIHCPDAAAFRGKAHCHGFSTNGTEPLTDTSQRNSKTGLSLTVARGVLARTEESTALEKNVNSEVVYTRSVLFE